MSDSESITPNEFWKRYAPSFPFLEDTKLTWPEIIRGLQRTHQLDCKTMEQLHQQVESAGRILKDHVYDPKIGPLTFICPICGTSYMHIQRALTVLSGDESGDGPIDGMAEFTWETGWRRPAVVVEIEGESCGHRFRLRLQQHKGEIFIFTESQEWKTIERLPDDVEITPEALALLDESD